MEASSKIEYSVYLGNLQSKNFHRRPQPGHHYSPGNRCPSCRNGICKEINSLTHASLANKILKVMAVVTSPAT